MPKQGTRARLRNGCAAAHRAVERLYESADITTEAGLVHFLAAHRIAVASIADALRGRPAEGVARAADRLVRLIDADLAELEVATGPTRRVIPSMEEDASGLAYVLAGSRLGARVLSRRIARSGSARSRRAVRYLTDNDPSWNRYLSALDSTSRSPAGMQATMHAALWGFACFMGAFHLARGRYQRVCESTAA